MRKILISFVRDKIQPHSQRINASKEKLAQITSAFADNLDQTALLLKETRSELEELDTKISALRAKILACDDEAASSVPAIRQPIDDADEMLSEKAILQKELASCIELHLITAGHTKYYEEQLSFPQKIIDLKDEIDAAQDALAGEAGELNKLLFEGEKKRLFSLGLTN